MVSDYILHLADVSTFISEFVVMFANLVKSGLNILASIQFLGTNLLSFFVYVFLLNIFLAIIFKLISSVGTRTGSIASREISKDRR